MVVSETASAHGIHVRVEIAGHPASRLVVARELAGDAIALAGIGVELDRMVVASRGAELVLRIGRIDGLVGRSAGLYFSAVSA